MSKVFNGQAADATSTLEATGPTGKAWVEVEGTFGGGTVTVQKESPGGNLNNLNINGVEQAYTAPFAVFVELGASCSLALDLSGSAGASVDGWITPVPR